jgi:hypothetical protein
LGYYDGLTCKTGDGVGIMTAMRLYSTAGRQSASRRQSRSWGNKDRGLGWWVCYQSIIGLEDTTPWGGGSGKSGSSLCIVYIIYHTYTIPIQTFDPLNSQYSKQISPISIGALFQPPFYECDYRRTSSRHLEGWAIGWFNAQNLKIAKQHKYKCLDITNLRLVYITKTTSNLRYVY